MLHTAVMLLELQTCSEYSGVLYQVYNLQVRVFYWLSIKSKGMSELLSFHNQNFVKCVEFL